jgi:hypothetical protein
MIGRPRRAFHGPEWMTQGCYNDDVQDECPGDPAGLDTDQDRQTAKQFDGGNETKSMKRLVPGLLRILVTSMNFIEPYTMNTADMSIRLSKITMSDIFPSRLFAAVIV